MTKYLKWIANLTDAQFFKMVAAELERRRATPENERVKRPSI
jgi:hypothetical protein